MYTVVVEVHLGKDGKKGTVFQVGSFTNANDAAQFGNELEWTIGENKITASILRSENLFEWLIKHTLVRRGIERKKLAPLADMVYPPCEADEEI